jgi:hypothetical protein
MNMRARMLDMENFVADIVSAEKVPARASNQCQLIFA